jgi:microcystin-dependent protein
MAEITGLTAEAMQAIVDATIASGSVDGSGHLILTTHGGTNIDAGDVTGPQGDEGPTGPTAAAPTGAVWMFTAPSSIPSGWLACDGSAVSRTTYSDLFALMGTTYGVGDGSTTFNVPNMEARFPRQQASAVGSTGGASSHSHQIDGGSTDAVAQISFFSASPAPLIDIKRISSPAWTSTVRKALSTFSDSGDTVTDGAKVVGQTSTASGLPPYLNFIYIIKT